MSDASLKRPVIVSEAKLIARDVKRIALSSADGRTLPPVDPGAHVDLWLPDGGARQYSIVERTPDGTGYVIAVLRDPNSRGGSAYVVDQVKTGQTMEISGPRNHFVLDERAADYLLIAGGIGVTPLIPMARRLTVAGRRFVLHYLNRSWDRAAFLDVLQAELPEECLGLHVDEAHGAPEVARLVGAPRPGAQIYVCGPSGLIDAVLAAARAWEPGAVRFERFTRESPEAPQAGGDFEVKLARSGRVLRVGADETILDVLGREGVAVDSVCREGTCGSCMVPMVAGEADHRDSIQTEAERLANDFICVCVSRARSPRIVLDL